MLLFSCIKVVGHQSRSIQYRINWEPLLATETSYSCTKTDKELSIGQIAVLTIDEPKTTKFIHEEAAMAILDGPAGKSVGGGAPPTRFSSAKVNTSIMPRASQHIVDDDAVHERRTIMCTGAPTGKTSVPRRARIACLPAT
jgi:hypothetical protein